MGITRDISRPVVSFVGTFRTNSTWSADTTGSTGHIVESATTYTGQITSVMDQRVMKTATDVGYELGLTIKAWEVLSA